MPDAQALVGMGENSVSMTKKSSKLSRRAVAAATIGLVGGGSLLLGGTPAQAADTSATVTGSCLSVLACDMNFSSSQVTVPSGSQLVVQNSVRGLLNGPVTVSVGGQSKSIAAGKSATFVFAKSYDQQSFTMSASSALLNSGPHSQVMVTPAAKPAPEPSHSVPPSQSPGTGAGTGGGATGGSSHGGVQAPGLPQGAPNQGQPPALLPPGLNVPNSNPAAKPPVVQPGLPNGADGGTPQNTAGGTPAGAAPTDPTAAGGTSNDSPGPLTLLVLVAAVIVAGVGSAAVRTMMGARGRFARAATR